MTHSFGDHTEFGDHAEWGEAGHGEDVEEETSHSATLPREIPLGGGMKLVISPDAFRSIMHTPEIEAQVQQRCQELVEMANALAVEEGAVYIQFVSNNPDNIRARGRVKPGNEAAKRDDAIHGTLLKALASVGSDPLPPSYGDWQGSQVIEPDATLEAATVIGEVLE
jgi:hypothetical protein